jgi:hypothetical protein
MKLQPYFLCLILVGIYFAWSCATARAGAISDLAVQKDLCPETLIRLFSGFTFELNAQRQAPEMFLQRKRGDCDDFANVANSLLSSRGYKTKLVMVMMEQQTHIVCYVEEARGFLDFNHRADAKPIIESDGTLEDIAQKVSKDFRAPWRTAAEFTYKDNLPVYLDTVFPLAAPAPQVRKAEMVMPNVVTTNGSAPSMQLLSAASDGIITSHHPQSPLPARAP